MAQRQEAGTAVNRTSTGIISETGGTLLGFYVNSTGGGTVVFAQGGASGATTGGTAISGTITPAIGFHRFPANIIGRLYVTIAGTIDITTIFAAG